ncbi:MAG: glucose 1-dehydrogenase [Isosphaeraceae bacterium]
MRLFDLTGRVALVTGGNGGIGLGIARGLADAGAELVLVGRNEEKSLRAAQMVDEESGCETLVVTADVAREEDAARAVAETITRFGRLDIVVNNAGTIVRRPPQDMTLDEWKAVIDTNLTAAFLVARAAYPALKAHGTGKVINIGSMTSLFGSSYASSYAASKGGIVQLTKSLALAWARDHIQVNAILPGWIETEMTDRAKSEVPGLNERVLTRVPMGRWGVPEDLAGTAIWLASAASDYVTGTAIPVDGGFSSNL